MAQRKETKITIKVRDLKPKKDARGGKIPPGSHSVNLRRGDGRQTNVRGDG